MKKFTTSFIFLFVSVALFSQNSVPEVSNVNGLLNNNTNKITVQFDVFDAEQTEFNANVLLSADDGNTFVFPIDSVTGENDIQIGTNEVDVFFNPDSLVAYGVLSAELLAKVTVTDNQAVDIQTIVDQVTAASLINWMSQVEGIRHRTGDSIHLNAVRDLLTNEMADANYFMRSQPFEFANYPSLNIIGRKSGSKQNNKTIVICGHYDTISNSPGADDNGSAVCGLLEAVNILQQYEFEKSLLFIGFDNEEDGLIGAYTFTGTGMANYETIESVLNMEMIGYYSDVPNSQTLPANFQIAFPSQVQLLEANDYRGDFITNVGSTIGSELTSSFAYNASTYVPDLSVISLNVLGTGQGLFDDLRRSDHAAFWDQTIPALMLTDGANFRNPYYHTPNDVSSHLNFDFMANVVKAIIATAASEAQVISASSAISSNLITAINTSNIEVENYQLNIFQNGEQTNLTYQLPQTIDNAKLFIYNLNGQKIDEVQLISNKNSIPLQLSSSTSIYLFSIVKDGQHSITKKMTINH